MKINKKGNGKIRRKLNSSITFKTEECSCVCTFNIKILELSADVISREVLLIVGKLKLRVRVNRIRQLWQLVAGSWRGEVEAVFASIGLGCVGQRILLAADKLHLKVGK